MEVSEIRRRLEAADITLSEALRLSLAKLDGLVAKEDITWIKNELEGYIVSETLPRELPEAERSKVPSGFVADRDTEELPDYRKLTNKTYALGPLTGSWNDVSDTAYGSMPILEPSSISRLEREVLPPMKQGKELGVPAFVGGNQTKKVIDPSAVEKLFEQVTVKLIGILNSAEAI
jgi:hypothetical protein